MNETRFAHIWGVLTTLGVCALVTIIDGPMMPMTFVFIGVFFLFWMLVIHMIEKSVAKRRSKR